MSLPGLAAVGNALATGGVLGGAVTATLGGAVTATLDGTVTAALDGTVTAALDGTVTAALGTLSAATGVGLVAALSAGGFPEFSWLSELVRHATGWPGLAIIFVYSFLIAFALPGVSEVVLVAPLDLGLPYWGRMSAIILVSGVGKAAGSVFAFHIGQEAKEAGPVIRALKRSRFDVIEWSERQTVEVARKWGYAGLALALCVPGFPDTLSIYAFAVLERDYLKFALATFAGSVGRLVLWLAGAEALVFLL